MPPIEKAISYLQAFTAMIQQAILRANQGCLEAALWLVGMTGTSKSAFAAAIVGCKLKYVPNPDSNDEFIPYFVEIESCPPGVTPPDIGNAGSKTRTPTAYKRGGSHPIGVVDTAGMLDTDKSMRIPMMVGSQIGIQTTQEIRGIPLMVPISRFRNVRATALRRDFMALATMFKNPLHQYRHSLHLVITQFTMGEPPSKATIIHSLTLILNSANEDAVRNPSTENINYAKLLSFFTSKEGEENILIFDPLNTATLDTWIASARLKPAIPTAELTFAGTQEVKNAFMEAYSHVLTESAKVLQTVVDTPKTIAILQKKEAALKKWLTDNPLSQAATGKKEIPTDKKESAETPKIGEAKPTKTNLEQIQDNYAKADAAVKTTKKQLEDLDSEQTTLSADSLALAKRTELVTVHSIEFDEGQLYFAKNPDNGNPHRDWAIAHGRSQFEIEAATRMGAGHIWDRVRTHVGTPYQGEPFTNIRYESRQYTLSRGGRIPCPYGGPSSKLTETIDGPKGSYRWTIETSWYCTDYLKIYLECPFNQRAENVKKREDWAKKIEANKATIAQLRPYLEVQTKARSVHEGKIVEILLLQTQHKREEESLERTRRVEAFQAKQVEYDDTKAAREAQQATYTEAVALFTRDQPTFQSIEGFYQVIGVDIDAGQQFHDLYVAALKQEHQERFYPNITRCTVKPPTTLEKAEASLRHSIFGGEKERPIRVDVAARPMCLPAEKSQGTGFFSSMNRAFQWAGNATGLMSTAQSAAPMDFLVLR